MARTERLVVIGGVAAGMSAASKARRANREMEITVFEKSGYVSYGACGFPYFIKGEIPRIEDLLVRTPEEFGKQGIQVHVRHEVTGIDVPGRCVQVRDLEGEREFEAKWDKLLITTGGAAVRPPLPGLDLPGVFTLRTPEDALSIRRWIDDRRPRPAVVVGGGYIGLEMAEALSANGMEVSVVEMLPQVLPNMDADMTKLVLEELEKQGVQVNLDTPVESFSGDERVTGVTAGGRKIAAELVILSVGIRPTAQLAKDAGIMLGPTGAIAVDDHQHTNLENVWAAGDVCESTNLVTGRPTWVALGTTANKQGKVAGENIAGGDTRFRGIVGTAVVKVFDLEVARTGLSESEAAKAGLDAAATMVSAPSRAHYMPGHKPVQVKLVYEQQSKRLLGGQMVGEEGVSKRIDILAAALQAGWSIRELAGVDLSYAPPFAPVWDPILVAANVALK